MDVMIGEGNLSNYSKFLPFHLSPDIGSNKLIVTLVFLSFILVTILFKILMSYLTPRYVHLISNELTNKVYRSTIYQNYRFHQINSTNQLITNIDLMNQTLGSLKIVLEGISSIMNILLLVGFLFFIEFKITIVVTLTIIIFFLFISLMLKLALYKSSVLITKYVNQKYKILYESIGNIKEILLNSSQENFIREFSTNNWNLNKKFIFQAVASLMPVHIIMFIIMTIFVI